MSGESYLEIIFEIKFNLALFSLNFHINITFNLIRPGDMDPDKFSGWDGVGLGGTKCPDSI